jgi:uncharacterized membrane protein
MAVKMYLEKEKIRRNTAIMQIIFGITCLVISIGLFATTDKYGIPIFALVVALFMIITGRQNWTIQ